jgi:hypothetical protein
VRGLGDAINAQGGKILEQVAETTGYSKERLRLWAFGAATYQSSEAQTVALALRVSLAELVNGTERPQPPREGPEPPFSRVEGAQDSRDTEAEHKAPLP